MGGEASLTALKAQSRLACHAARDGVGLKARAAAATRLYARLMNLRGRTVAGYLPIGSEADPRGTMRALCRDNRICVPVVTAKGAPLRFREWAPGCALETGAFGVSIPVDGGWRVPDVLIVPMLGFDAGGGRLGYGGGFYDRTLAGLRGALVVGLALEAQRMDAVPQERTDVRLPWIVTEAGVFGDETLR
ncbi:5-formyltetrahydrofolate cyclo-ligase family protein [Jannaschia seosinensis]|uniref:5-formyltetrahydrofolate cyclo-ligase n=1 Tax=Jannaschia seosinensis TaxID=313367 RepID=A0A0M7BG32_9RHOB|nr:5-formyltetrahydrofolate cyclo-ligase [Jannaschia seosinensis]CUH41119.1 5-formyltetrahydrofolate cyclo-ligase family protein [Jannaschia seosinensis]